MLKGGRVKENNEMIQKRLRDITNSLQRSLDHEESGDCIDSMKGKDGKPNVHYMLGYYRQTIASALLNIGYLSRNIEKGAF